MTITIDPLRAERLQVGSPAPVVEAGSVLRFQNALQRLQNHSVTMGDALQSATVNTINVEAMIALQTRLTVLSDEIDAGSKIIGRGAQTVDMLLKGS